MKFGPQKIGRKTVDNHCPYCGHTKAWENKPKICSRCGKENKGFELKKEKHKRERWRPVK